MGRFNYNFEAEIFRLSYTGTPSKGTYASIGTVLGMFSPLDQDQNVVGIQTMGQAYQFQTDPDTLIKAGDRLTIDSITYIVRGVRKFDMKRQIFQDIILELPENNG